VVVFCIAFLKFGREIDPLSEMPVIMWLMI